MSLHEIIRLLSVGILLKGVFLQAQTVTQVVEYTPGQSGQPALALDGDYAYVLYTDGSSYKGRICRENLVTGSTNWSGDLFNTIAPGDASHNGAAIAVDGDGHIHAWIGMHNHKMKYYRSNTPGSYTSFTDRSSTMPGYSDTGLDEKRYTYPAAVTATNGDVIFIARRTGLFIDGSGRLRESQQNEKQDLYHWDDSSNTWTLLTVKEQTGKNAYMSNLNTDENNNVHIVTAWSQLHSGDNTFQRGTYLRYNITAGTFHKADGTQVSIPVNVDSADADLFYPGEQPWGNTTCEIQTPQVTLNGLGNPIVAYPKNTNNYSQNNPDYVLNVATWTGSAWVTNTNIQDVRNHERPPITYTGGWVNTYGRDSSKSYIQSSTDNGLNFTQTLQMNDGGEPYHAWQYSPNTDIFINWRRIYKVVYPNTPNVAPSVNLTAPAGDASFFTGTDITITASAGDSDGTVSKVEFFESANSLGTDSSASDGWTITWNNVSSGSYSLTAVATDNDSDSTTSTAVNITVADPDPNADLDGDYFINLFEGAFGLDMFSPDSASNWPAMSPVESGGNQYAGITYRRLAGGSGTTGVNYTAGGYQYKVEVSSSMESVSWQSGSSKVTSVGSPVNNGDGTETVTVRAKSDLDSGGNFLRLEVTETP